jgi:hypothetical protein
MTVLVTLDTETGIIRRWAERTNTHVAGLTHDPEDALKTSALIESFRVNPHMDHQVRSTGRRDFDDALREQRARGGGPPGQQLLIEDHR